jgi:hypothetical protein
MQGIQFICNEIDDHVNMIDYLSSRCRCSTKRWDTTAPVFSGGSEKAGAADLRG